MNFKEITVNLKDGTSCILRSPNENDAKQMIEYLKLTSSETYFMNRNPSETENDIDREKEKLKYILKSDKDIMIAAFIEGELAGNSGVSCIRNLEKLKHRAVFGISIKEKFWNKGIGSILINECINNAKIMKFEQVELGVYSDNTKAQNLYQKYGFSVWGIIKNAFKLKDGSYRDEIMMGKIL